MSRTLVIGDVHGCYRAFETLLGFIALQPTDTLITLGDLIDRGPQSFQVMERMIALRQSHHLIALRGNHECLMLCAADDPQASRHWMVSGGAETLDSYNVLCSGLAQLEDVPDSHWHFLRECLVSYHETDQHIFVHGGVDPELPMDQQNEQTLYWKRYSDNCPGHNSGKLVICGHELQASGLPVSNGQVICIDSGAWKTGWLTCLDAETQEVWQANGRGHTRKVSLNITQ